MKSNTAGLPCFRVSVEKTLASAAASLLIGCTCVERSLFFSQKPLDKLSHVLPTSSSDNPAHIWVPALLHAVRSSLLLSLWVTLTWFYLLALLVLPPSLHYKLFFYFPHKCCCPRTSCLCKQFLFLLSCQSRNPILSYAVRYYLQTSNFSALSTTQISILSSRRLHVPACYIHIVSRKFHEYLDSTPLKVT